MWLPAPLSSDGMNCWSWSAVHSEQSQGWANRHQSCLGDSQSSILFSVWERANPPSCHSWCITWTSRTALPTLPLPVSTQFWHLGLPTHCWSHQNLARVCFHSLSAHQPDAETLHCDSFKLFITSLSWLPNLHFM